MVYLSKNIILCCPYPHYSTYLELSLSLVLASLLSSSEFESVIDVEVLLGSALVSSRDLDLGRFLAGESHCDVVDVFFLLFFEGEIFDLVLLLLSWLWWWWWWWRWVCNLQRKKLEITTEKKVFSPIHKFLGFTSSRCFHP